MSNFSPAAIVVFIVLDSTEIEPDGVDINVRSIIEGCYNGVITEEINLKNVILSYTLSGIEIEDSSNGNIF